VALFIGGRTKAIRSESGAIWRLAWPILIAQLATAGMSVSDVAMSGRLSADDIAAVSLGASCWGLAFATMVGLMMPVNVLVAHEFGAGKFDRIPHVVRQALWTALGLSLVAIVAINVMAGVFGFLDLPPVVHEKAIAFVRVISLGLPAFAGYRTLYGYSASLGRTKPMMIIALSALCFNVLANWLLVYGHWGLPKFGAVGCAISTASGLWLMLFAMAWWIQRSGAYRTTSPFTRWEWPEWKQIGSMLRLGVPMGVTYFAEVSAFAAVCLLVARLGAIEMAANMIVLNFTSLTFVMPFSIGIASLTRVGQALGRGDPERARFSAWTGGGMSFALGIVAAIFTAAAREQIAVAYSIDPTVQAMTALPLVIAALFQLSDATQISVACIIRGYKVTRAPMFIQLAAFWGISLPVGYMLGMGCVPDWLRGFVPTRLGVTGFWIGLAAGLTVSAVLLVTLMNRLSRQRISAARDGLIADGQAVSSR
jgi:MATE family multidrug resistance protein